MSTDKYHGPATEYFRGALEDGTRFITGRPVLIEYIDGVAKRIGKSEAVEELRLLESTATLRIESDDRRQVGRLVRVGFKQRLDHSAQGRVGSFAIMDR